MVAGRAMIPFLLSALGFGKSVFSAVIDWLSRRSLAEIACIALAIACLVLVVANQAEKRHSEKLQRQVVSLSAELKRISDARKTQKFTTQEKISVATKIIHDADSRAKVVEQAPPAVDCHTKPEVMGADL
jgi:hypothetical protein